MTAHLTDTQNPFASLGSADFLKAGQQLLPRGVAWNKDPTSIATAFTRGITDNFAALHATAGQLSEIEADPRTTAAMLTDWETAFGLPDPCITAAIVVTGVAKNANVATGYHIGDIVTLVGGVGVQATILITGTASGVPNAFTVLTQGLYTVAPSGAVATTVTPSGGTGLQFTLSLTTATQTTDQRRAALVSKIITLGGQSKAYYIAVAAALGYAITIEEFLPFRVDINAVGDALAGPGFLFTWLVTASASNDQTFFRVDLSTVETPLVTQQSTPLQCVLTRLAPVHTVLLFAFTS